MPELLPRELIRRASDRYRRVAPFHRWYAWFKYRMDPCYMAIAVNIPPETLTVDLGTGLGMLPVMLSLVGGQRRSLGVEHDRAKTVSATQATEGLPGVEIREANAMAMDIPPCDVVTIIDVLHYYPAETQRHLLARCAIALRPGGKLLIRDADRNNGGMSWWTRGIEKLAVRFGWNKGVQASFRTMGEVVFELESLGFTVSQLSVSGRLHPGNVLLIASR